MLYIPIFLYAYGYLFFQDKINTIISQLVRKSYHHAMCLKYT